MAFLLLSRNFGYITEHSTCFFNTSVVKKLNGAASILDNNRNIQPMCNIEMKKEFSTISLIKGEVHTSNISSKQSDSFLPLLNHQYPLSFWGRARKFPVKCRIKCNNFGKQIAEPYIAKKPTPINFERLTKDFTINFDHKCEKLQGNELKCQSRTEIKPRLTKKCLKSQLEGPNALTKYLQKKDKCNNIYRGNKGACAKYLQNKNECKNLFKGNEEACLEYIQKKEECNNVYRENIKTNASLMQKKDQCENIYRGYEEDCVIYIQKKDECNNVYTGNKETYAKENSSSTSVATCTLSSKSKENKAKKLMNNLISKLKSMKLMKSSGFISDDLITEVIKQLRVNFPKSRKLVTEAINQLRVNFVMNKAPLRDLTRAKETLASIEMSNCEKSLVRKFGERSKSQQFSIQPKFVEETSFNKIKEGKPSKRSNVLTGQKTVMNNLAKSNFGAKIVKDGMNRNKGSNVKLKRTEDNKTLSKRDNTPKPYGDTIPIQSDLPNGDANVKKKNIKVKRKTTYKPRSRQGVRLGKRKRKFSFSKIPIQPNVKGSVIFVKETTQPLDDPCRILSVNFFTNDDIAFEDLKKEGDGVNEYNTAVGQFTAIQARSNGFIKNTEVKKIPTQTKIFQGYYEERRDIGKERVQGNLIVEGKKNQYSEGEVLVNFRTRKYDNLHKQDEKYFRSNSPPEPIIRRKKISKLDKNITSFVTTVFPEEKLSLSKFKKNKSVQEKFGFISLDDGVEEISTNVLLEQNDGHSNESKEKVKAKSTSSMNSDFYRKIAEIPNFKSEESIWRMNETTEPEEKLSIAENMMMGKCGFKKGIIVSPGLTRPVTQKTAHLDILKTKPFAPISNIWKNSTASTGRIASTKKNRKKKVIRSTNNLAILETKDHDLQQTRWKSTTSWKSKCECEEKPCPTEKKDYDEKANCLYPLPVDWDYEGAAPPPLARKWATTECHHAEDIGCPITSDDMKKGPPCRRPLSAAALNRCNYDECKNRMRRRKCGYRGGKKTIGTGC